MNVIKNLYKLLENPKSIQNYIDLKECLIQNNMLQFAEAFDYLIKVKYGANNSNNASEDKK